MRQCEVAKPRRSNMTNSSINAPSKKGGAGGSFTWGTAGDVIEDDLIGFDVSSVGITAAPAPIDAPIDTSPLDGRLSLDDKEQFPALTASMTTPEKVSKPVMKKQSETEDVTANVETAEEVTQDWIVVPKTEVAAARGHNENRKPSNTYDNQHPRNMFRRTPQAKRATSTDRRRMPDIDIDWSQAGVPTEVKKQIIHASMTPSHRGPYGKEQVSAVALNVLRTQNRGSSTKRANSEPKTPRSQSKPRAIQQPVGRR